MKAMTERNDETVRRMHEDRIRLETALSQARTEGERHKIELDQKVTQLEIMGQTLSGAGSPPSSRHPHLATTLQRPFYHLSLIRQPCSEG